MKRLTRWAARLYPSEWRARYGAEMEALLEDAGPCGGDVWDLLRGALHMRMTSLSFWKIVTGCALAGLLAAGIWSAVAPARYVSTAVIRIDAAPIEAQRQMMQLQPYAFSRSALTSIITGENLYVKERAKQPLEDIILGMRDRDVRIRRTYVPGTAGGPAFAVEFISQNPVEAQATARALVSSLIEQNLQFAKNAGGGANMEVLVPASLPSHPVSPDRRRMMIEGLLAGLLLGLVSGAVWFIVRGKRLWTFRQVAAFAAGGAVFGLAVAYLIPDEFVSTAVLHARDGGSLQPTIAAALSDDSLTKLIHDNALFPRELSVSEGTRRMRNELIRVQKVQAGAGREAIVISFRYPDRFKAQAVTRDLVNRVFTARPRYTTEVLDPANLPSSPSSPNRVGIVGLAALGGILLGLTASRFRPKFATA